MEVRKCHLSIPVADLKLVFSNKNISDPNKTITKNVMSMLLNKKINIIYHEICVLKSYVKLFSFIKWALCC